MDKTKHNQEIINSRVGGFGSSDAALFVRIAKKGGVTNLSRTDNHRIAVALGIVPPVGTPTTEAMERGHRFEDWYENNILNTATNIEREKRLEHLAGDMSVYMPTNFRLFAHADFFDNTRNEVLELKCSQYEFGKVYSDYYSQLQWYYLMEGVNSVMLIHCKPNTTNPFEGEFDIITSEDVLFDENMADTLQNGIQLLDEAISEGWKPSVSDTATTEELPEFMQDNISILKKIQANIKALQNEEAMIKEEMLEYMTDNGLASLLDDEVTVTMVGATETKSFDSTAFFKAHPELKTEKDKFQKVSQRKAYLTIKAK